MRDFENGNAANAFNKSGLILSVDPENKIHNQHVKSHMAYVFLESMNMVSEHAGAFPLLIFVLPCFHTLTSGHLPAFQGSFCIWGSPCSLFYSFPPFLSVPIETIFYFYKRFFFKKYICIYSWM